MTEQSSLWQSDFGDAYISRNNGPDIVRSNRYFFSQIFDHLDSKPESIFEIGASVGLNLDAIRDLIPSISLGAVEVNSKACDELRKKNIETYESSIEDWIPATSQWDLSFSKGVLIHLNPQSLESTYTKLARTSKKWVLICEYFSRSVTELEYRGQTRALYKRDFAAEFLQYNKDFVFHAAGFSSRLSEHPQDDLTWFLLKRASHTARVFVS